MRALTIEEKKENLVFLINTKSKVINVIQLIMELIKAQKTLLKISFCQLKRFTSNKMKIKLSMFH